jgi:hypothetical protein
MKMGRAEVMVLLDKFRHIRLGEHTVAEHRECGA